MFTVGDGDSAAPAAPAAAAAAARARFEAAQAARRAAAAERRAVGASDAPEEESVPAFTSRCEAARRQVESELASLPADAAASAAALARARAAAAALEADAAACAYFLPAYESRAAATLAASLRARLAAAEAAVAPAAAFSFGEPPPAQAQPEPAAAAPAPPPPPAPLPAAAEADAPPGLRGLRGETRLLTQVDLGSSLSGFAVEDCEDCIIWLLGSLRALRLRRLSSVRLVALAVDGAVYAEHCNACALHVVAAQLRVHDCERSAFYALLRSRAVVERCRGLGFGPLALPPPLRAWPGVGEALAQARLSLDGQGETRVEVDDFSWLRATQSPHWRRLEEGERESPPQPAV